MSSRGPFPPKTFHDSIRGQGTGVRDPNAAEARGQVLAVPQHLRFTGAGGIAAPGLQQRERTLRPLPPWRLPSPSPPSASECAWQMVRDEQDWSSPAGRGTAAGAGPCPRAGSGLDFGGCNSRGACRCLME